MPALSAEYAALTGRSASIAYHALTVPLDAISVFRSERGAPAVAGESVLTAAKE